MTNPHYPKPKQKGERTEGFLGEIYPIKFLPEKNPYFADAITTCAIRDGETSIPKNTPIEIKSVNVVIGERQRRGRVKFRKSQHGKLKQNFGYYAVVITEPNHPNDPIIWKFLKASEIEIPSWIPEPSGRSDYAQTTWSNLIHPKNLDSQE